jgi:hypothetical protein
MWLLTTWACWTLASMTMALVNDLLRVLLLLVWSRVELVLLGLLLRVALGGGFADLVYSPESTTNEKSGFDETHCGFYRRLEGWDGLSRDSRNRDGRVYTGSCDSVEGDTKDDVASSVRALDVMRVRDEIL